MGDTERWVSDELHGLLGMSEKNLVHYVIALASRSKDEASFLSSLRDNGVPINDTSRKFAVNLMKKVPRAEDAQAKAERAARERQLQEKERERQKVEFLKKNSSYTLVEDDDPAAKEAAAKAEEKAQKKLAKLEKKEAKLAKKEEKKEAKEKKRQLRKKSKWSDEEEEDTKDEPANKRAKLDDEANDDDDEVLEEWEIEELQRVKDLQERDEFANRLKKRDEARTKKLVGEKDLDEIEGVMEGGEKRRMTEEEKKLMLEESRIVSRQAYLEKREHKKIDELVESIEDEKRLFEGVELTAKEKRDFAVKQRVLDLVKQRDATIDNTPNYVMPENYDDTTKPEARSRRYKVLDSRYDEAEDNVGPTDCDVHESLQIEHAMVTVGRKKEKAIRGEEYELVLEDQVDFVKDALSSAEVNYLEPPDEESVKERERRSMAEERASLPIYPYREQLLDAIAEEQILIIVGETGSGKTTQIMQYLIEAGYCEGGGKIACTQPRRVAAMSVAKRVADEVGCKLGHDVGYKIRFEDATSEKTKLVYMTDGMMLREFLGEPDMASYNVIMVDEAHERTLHTDVLFGLVKDVARFRHRGSEHGELKLLISSATMDAQKFHEYFDGAPIFTIPGRRYPVDVFYTKAPEANYLEAAVVTCLQIHVTQGRGDILVFMPGQQEIEGVVELLNERTKGFGTKLGELIVLPIYSTLPSHEQSKIFEETPPGARKVVVATNIAETSLTIDGIVFVIDPGFVKQKSFNPRTGMESLVVTQVSKAAAQQRSGRAGRTAPGKCFRLYTAWAYKNELPENTIPEIQRTNLGNVVLMLKALGIEDLVHFDFMDPPPPETIMRALEQLYALGALNAQGELTKTGRRMAEFPLDPMMSKMMLGAETYGVSEEICTICAMLSIGNQVFYRPKEKAVHADNAKINFNRGAQGDHISLMNVYNQWVETGESTQWCFENFIQVRSLKKARDVRDQILGLFERTEIELTSNATDTRAIRKAITSGYFYHTALLQRSGDYRTLKKPQTVFMHPQGALAKAQPPPRLVCYFELVRTAKDYMRTVSEIESDWLIEIAPHLYKPKDVETVDTKKMPKAVGKAGGGTTVAASE